MTTERNIYREFHYGAKPKPKAIWHLQILRFGVRWENEGTTGGYALCVFKKNVLLRQGFKKEHLKIV